MLPTLALDSAVPVTDDGVTLTISVYANEATPGTDDARDTRVRNPGGGVTVWVAGNDEAYNQVYVQVASAETLALEGEGQGVTVRNASTSRGLQSLVHKLDGADRLWTDRAAGTEEHTWAEWQAFVGDGNDATSLPKTLFPVLTHSQSAKLDITAAGGADSFTVVSSAYVKEQEEKGVEAGTDGTATEPAAAELIEGTIYFLVAGDNDRIRITATGSHGTGTDLVNFSVVNSAELKVDATPPAITGTMPSNKRVQGRTVATFGATFTDSGSGLRDDSEDLDYDVADTSGDRVVDGDSDELTTTEPITVRWASGTNDADRGAPADLIITAGTQEADGKTPAKPAGTGSGETATGIFLATNNKLKGATSSWRVVTDGFRVEYTDSNLLPAESSDVIYFAFGAVDRVGNFKKVEDQTLVIDTDPPGMSQAQAGIGYRSTRDDAKSHSMQHDIPSLRSIKITFDGGVDGDETLDASSIEKADFRVETADAVELPIEELIHPTITSSRTTDGKTVTTTTNHIVWLVLVDPLAPGARPTVNIVGTILDTAGNRLGAGQGSASSRRADDETRPEFTVRATGSVAERAAATGSVDDRVTIRVTSTEALQRTPSIYLVQFDYQKDDPDTADKDEAAVIVKEGSVTTPGSVLTAVSGATNTWEITLEGLDDGLWGVFITGDDPENNTGTTPGITTGEDGRPRGGDVVTDLSKITLFEIDSSLEKLTDASFVLTPSTNKKTQSRSPFIRINFSEGKEYQVGGEDMQQQVVIDTHNNVTLTKLDIQPAGGEAEPLLGTEGRVNAESFLVSLSDLSVGKYTLIVNGEDELGNPLVGGDYKYNFEVEERTPYMLDLWPGNNLVSLPGEPVDPSIDAVLPGSHPATAVLAYAPTDPVGPWLAATREPGGLWSGSLTEIRAGHGYWIETSAFTPVSAQLQERGSGEVPPTFPLTQGWNLIGVVAASNDSIKDVSATAYLASVNWSVAYTYDTSNNSWAKVTKGDDDAMLSPGQGVWVWLEAADVLAP